MEGFSVSWKKEGFGQVQDEGLRPVTGYCEKEKCQGNL